MAVNAAETLKRIIKESGKTRNSIAADLGMSRQLFSQYVTRSPDTMSFRTLQKILDYFGYEVIIEKKKTSDAVKAGNENIS